MEKQEVNRMTNVEHLFETGLNLMKTKTPVEWMDIMSKNVNWTDEIRISIDELWLICQYTIYSYCFDCEYKTEEASYDVL